MSNNRRPLAPAPENYLSLHPTPLYPTLVVNTHALQCASTKLRSEEAPRTGLQLYIPVLGFAIASGFWAVPFCPTLSDRDPGEVGRQRDLAQRRAPAEGEKGRALYFF